MPDKKVRIEHVYATADGEVSLKDSDLVEVRLLAVLATY
jgi:hypothetical protein